MLAFPSNDFGQAQSSDECECAFLDYKMNATAGNGVPCFDKVRLHGPGTAECFTILQMGGGPGNMISWNNAKYLVDANGTYIARYAPEADPMTAEADVRRVLGLPPTSA